MPDKNVLPKSPSPRSRWVMAAVLAAIALAMTAGTLMVRARAAWSRGAASLSREALESAATDFERALGYYLPGDPVFRKSIAGMRTIAARLEAAGDIEGAWRTMDRLQAAIRETSSILGGHGTILRELAAEQHRIESRLLAAGNRVAPPAGPATAAADPLWSSLTVLFLGAWVALTIILSTRIGKGKLLLPWAAAALAAWVAWAVSLWLA